MKKYLLALLAAILLGPPLWAQSGVSGNLNAQTTDCTVTNACIAVVIPPATGGGTISIAGTFSATSQFEVSADPRSTAMAARHWVALLVSPSNSAATVSSATAAGAWQVNLSGYTAIRIRVSTYVSGTVAAAINLSPISARGGAGGGNATIAGTIAAAQVAFGSAANTITGSANLTYTTATHSLNQNNASTATPFGGTDIVRGVGSGTDGFFGAGIPVLRETIAETHTPVTHATWDKAGPAGNEFLEYFPDDTGLYVLRNYDGTTSSIIQFDLGGGLEFLPAGGTTVRIGNSTASSALVVNTAGDTKAVTYSMNNAGGHMFESSVAPTISSGFGTGASITASNGTAAFRINVGTSNTGNGIIALPAATTGWNCFASDVTNTSATVSQTKQVAVASTTLVTLQNYTDLSATGAWTDSDVLAVSCFAY